MGTWVGAIRTRLADGGEVRHAASLGGDVAEMSSRRSWEERSAGGIGRQSRGRYNRCPFTENV